MENSDSILKQLKIIKWLAIFMSVCIFIVVSSIAAFSLLAWKGFEEGYANSSMYDEGFNTKVSDLIDEGKTEEAIKLVNKHIKNHPNDEYGYWYRGLAYYHQKQWQPAIDDFSKTEELAPSWKKSYTEPYRAAAKSKLDKQQD